MSNFVSIESGLDETRRKNFFWYGAFSSFVWMCFHFTLVFFFLLQLGSPVTVGIFLGIGNFIAFLVDPPVGVLQKYFSAKKLFTASAIMMLIVSVIFLSFIMSTGNVSFSDAKEYLTLSKEAYQNLFASMPNILLLLLSVILYGIIKELSDVTSLSYIMNNADPSEYSELLSKNNIFSGLGCLVGLLSSGVILTFNSLLAVSILVGIIVGFIIYILKYFDNSKEQFKINIDLSQVKNFKVVASMNTVEAVKSYAVAQVKKADFAQAAKGMKFIFLKPLEIKKSVDWKEIYQVTKDDLKSFFNILFSAPYSHKLLVFGSILTFFGFWDTFVTSFLIDFLDGIIEKSGDELSIFKSIMSSYVFIAILALPAYGLQVPFIGLSKKIGTFSVILAGVLISGISLFFFGVVSTFMMILVLGILNSVGYAAGMPLSQGEFSDEYNVVYAKKKNLSEIDSNASSAPLKMLLNLANVVGFIIGGALVGALGYSATFIFCGMLLVGIFLVSVINKKKWNL